MGLREVLTQGNHWPLVHARDSAKGLQSTNTTDRAFDGVLDVYGLLGAQLLPLTQFEEFFQRFPFAIECIVNIYHDIQRFHSIAYRLFSLTTKRKISFVETNLARLTYPSMAASSEAYLG